MSFRRVEDRYFKKICVLNNWGHDEHSDKDSLVDHILRTYQTLAICSEMEHITEDKQRYLKNRCEHIKNIVELARR